MSRKRQLDTFVEDKRLVKPLSAFEAARARLNSSNPPLTEQPQAQSPKEVTEENLPVEDEVVYNSDLEFENASSPERSIDGWKALASWQPSKSNILDSNSARVAIRLQHQEAIANVGSYVLEVTRGTVSIHGAELSARSGPTEIYASPTHSIPTISCISEAGADISLSNCAPACAELGQISPLYRGLWNDTLGRNDSDHHRSFDRIDASRQDPLGRSIHPLVIYREWKDAAESLFLSNDQSSTDKAPPSILITGSRRSGKSSFAKYLLNRYLTALRPVSSKGQRQPNAKGHGSIFLLDLDTERPLHAPPGQISLTRLKRTDLAPSFMHCMSRNSKLREIVDACAMPAKTMEERPLYYLQCLKKLVRTYKNICKMSQPSPLIADCPAEFLGNEEFLSKALETLNPTNVVSLCADNEKPLPPRKILEQSVVNVVSLPAAPKQPVALTMRSEKQLQEMQILSCFHQITRSVPYPRFQATPITEMRSIHVNFNSKAPGCMGLLLSNDIEPEFANSVLSESIVSVISIQSSDAIAKLEKRSSSESHQLPYIESRNEDDWTQMLDPNTAKLVCLAFIKNVHMDHQTLEMIVPSIYEPNLKDLASGNLILLHGCLPVPSWALKEDLYKKEGDRQRLLRNLQSQNLPEEVRVSEAQYRRPYSGRLVDRGSYSKLFWGNIALTQAT